MTYFDVRNIVAYLGIYPTLQITRTVNLNPVSALGVLTAWSLALLLLIIGVAALRRAFANRRYVRLKSACLER